MPTMTEMIVSIIDDEATKQRYLELDTQIQPLNKKLVTLLARKHVTVSAGFHLSREIDVAKAIGATTEGLMSRISTCYGELDDIVEEETKLRAEIKEIEAAQLALLLTYIHSRTFGRSRP